MANDRSNILRKRLNWLKNREKALADQPETNARNKNLMKIRSSMQEVQGVIDKRRDR